MIISNEHAETTLGNQLAFVQAADGTVYVPLKRLCECLKIDYEGQRSKVRNSEVLNAELLSVPGTDGRLRKMLCLPVDAVGDWASTIDPSSLSPEVVEALADLLEESDEDLDGYEAHERAAKARSQVIAPDAPGNRMVEAAECIQDNHPKLRRNLCDEIGYFMKEIRAEIDWLDERCQTEIIGCKSDEDLLRLGLIRNFLHKIREDLRTESYRLSKSDIMASVLNEDPDDLM